MRTALISIGLLLCLASTAVGQAASQTAGQELSRIVVLDECRYSGPEQAQAAWRPIERQTPPIQVDQGRLKLPCNFATNDQWRVGWDRKGQWDLSACQQILLTVTTESDSLVRMLLYFQSGRGWYGCNFVAGGGTQRIELPRHKFGTEGQPGGWDRIEAIRLCVQVGEQVDSAVEVSDMRAAGVPAGVAVYRNDAGLKAESGVPHYARLMADQLDRIEIPCEILGDEEIAAGRLAGKKIAILPLNPVLPASAGEALRKFVAGGGKLLVCYQLPSPLPELLAVRASGAVDGADGRLNAIRLAGRGGRPAIVAAQHSWIAHRVEPLAGTSVVGVWLDVKGTPTALPAITSNANGLFVAHVLTAEDPQRKDALVMEMLGGLWPELWARCYQRRLAGLGKVGGADGMADLSVMVKANAAGDPARLRVVSELLTRAGQAASEAASAMDKGQAAAAVEKIDCARQACLEAYAAGIPSRSPEFRAVWCHSPTGVADMTWPQAAKAMADAGFNAIIPNMCWGSGAAYPSQFLPTVPEARGRDLLKECLDAARSNGLTVHVWKVNWNCWRSPEFTAQMRRAGRLQQTAGGAEVDWLCPSHPDNQKLELESMLEIVRNYQVAGIHFDYIRYLDGNVCYCPNCRRKYEQTRQVKVADWPAEVFSGKRREDYRQFRRDNITALVAAVSEQARKIRKDILISAAVFPHWPSARTELGQDWRLWVERGYLDLVCPMQYTDSPPAFDAMLRATTGWTGTGAALCPGIGATLGNSPDGTIQQIQIARRLNAAGFVLFNYDPVLAGQHLPLLRLGATAQKATWTPPGRLADQRAR